MNNKMLQQASLLVLALVLPCLMLAQGGSCTPNTTNKLNVKSFNKFLPNASVDSGVYAMEKNGNDICTELSDKGNVKHYMIETCFDLSDFTSRSDASSAINRNSGVLVFTSTTQNAGTFTFTKNPAFVSFLQKEGVALDNDLYYFKLFLGDIEEAYVRDIKALGFQPTITELGRLVWHDASVSYIKEMHELFPDFSLNDISMLSAHEISTDYVQSFLDAGIQEIDVHSIKKAKRMDITARTIKKQQRLGNNFSDLGAYIRLLKKKR